MSNWKQWPRVDGLCVSVTTQPLVAMLVEPHWETDKHGARYQRATRINGHFVCPDCGLVWPLWEDVEAWIAGRDTGWWYASEWGPGYGFCQECQLAFHEGFDSDYIIRCGHGQ